MGVLMSMLGQTVGFPVPQGGAGELTQALARRLVAAGGEIRCGHTVNGIEVEAGRATGVRTSDGQRFTARHAVVADVAAPCLYGDLVSADDLPARTTRAMRSFQLDPGTVKVDWALDGPVPWASAPAYPPGTFHVADSVEDMSEALGQVSARAIPARPFMLAGQMTTTDPTSLAGRHRVAVGLHPRAPGCASATPGTTGSRAPGTTTTASGSPTGCRRASRGSRPGSGRGSCRAGCSARASSRPGTPTSSAVPSTAARRSCTRS